MTQITCRTLKLMIFYQQASLAKVDTLDWASTGDDDEAVDVVDIRIMEASHVALNLPRDSRTQYWDSLCIIWMRRTDSFSSKSE